MAASRENARICIEINVFVRGECEQVSLHGFDVVAPMFLAVLCVRALLSTNRGAPAAARQSLVASLGAWNPSAWSGARHWASLGVRALHSRAALLLHAGTTELGADLTTVCMRAACVAFRRTKWARFTFVAIVRATVLACVVCTIAFLIALSVVGLADFATRAGLTLRTRHMTDMPTI
jgi:hypothetical protein